eukprot:4113754-Amphidinium_carterae.1
MDHAGRAANRHVLHVKYTDLAFHHAPHLWSLLLPSCSDPVETNNFARLWKVCPRQVGMA